MKKGNLHSEETKRKISKKLKGKKRNPLSIEHKRKLSEDRKGEKNPFYGKHHSEITRKEISKASKGKNNPNYGKHFSKEIKQKMSEAKKGKYDNENHPNWKGGEIKIICKICKKEKYIKPYSIKIGKGIFCSHNCAAINRNIHMRKHDTDIEIIIEKELIHRDIPYTKQVPLLGITLVDFLLPHDIVIYADGGYWHSLKGRKEKDMNQDYMLTFYGYRVFRFTDKEIKASIKECIDKII